MKSRSQIERRRERPTKIYLETKDVADLMGWNTDKARYWLLRDGAAEKHGGRWYTTKSRLLAAFPEHFETAGEKTFLETSDVARLMGWSTDQARYWLMREGAATKRGGRWYTTESRLRATFPQAFQALAY